MAWGLGCMQYEPAWAEHELQCSSTISCCTTALQRVSATHIFHARSESHEAALDAAHAFQVACCDTVCQAVQGGVGCCL